MRYINKERQNKDVNKDNEIYTKAKQRCKQRQWDIYKGKTKCKQRQWDIYKGINKDVNKDNRYTKDKQRCKQRQWDIYKG